MGDRRATLGDWSRVARLTPIQGPMEAQVQDLPRHRRCDGATMGIDMYELAMLTPAGWSNDGYGEAVRSEHSQDITDAARQLWQLGGDWLTARFGLVTDDDWDRVEEFDRATHLQELNEMGDASATTAGLIPDGWWDACIDNATGDHIPRNTVLQWIATALNATNVDVDNGSVWADGRWLSQSEIDDITARIDAGV